MITIIMINIIIQVGEKGVSPVTLGKTKVG